MIPVSLSIFLSMNFSYINSIQLPQESLHLPLEKSEIPGLRVSDCVSYFRSLSWTILTNIATPILLAFIHYSNRFLTLCLRSFCWMYATTPENSPMGARAFSVHYLYRYMTHRNTHTPQQTRSPKEHKLEMLHSFKKYVFI